MEGKHIGSKFFNLLFKCLQDNARYCIGHISSLLILWCCLSIVNHALQNGKPIIDGDTGYLHHMLYLQVPIIAYHI